MIGGSVWANAAVFDATSTSAPFRSSRRENIGSPSCGAIVARLVVPAKWELRLPAAVNVVGVREISTVVFLLIFTAKLLVFLNGSRHRVPGTLRET
jgi:hypothetical protein